MALIPSNTAKAEVQALGTAMDATVSFNGALMEMLATVYVYILMAAIREAVQNATDAAKRAGLSFAEGVLVQLPTIANPMITVIDKGSGMTKDFMENEYLSFGTSTKSGDNGAAGGLGVGRWAAYGYIRESYITTCHASDMVERTYFQFQGANGTPQVQLASETPGAATGTRVFFPVKDSDLDEALRAVAWLRETMQLAMGDTFSVDTPALLPTVLPAFSGTILDLETEDAGLKGVLVYPMQGNALKYGRQGLQEGSLLVMTNKEAGVGGLPFHVQSPTTAESVFANGMIVEIPMSFGIPFMPSREEIKYTDEVNVLLKRIDAAAAKAVVTKAKELYQHPDLSAKAKLSNLLGNTERWHWFARSSREVSLLHEPLRKATGGDPWTGMMKIPMLSEMRSSSLTCKVATAKDGVLQDAFSELGFMAVSSGKGRYVKVMFLPDNPVTLVVNDVKTGGTARLRKWFDSARGTQLFVFLSSAVAGEAQAAAVALQAVFGSTVAILKTSSMPAVARVVVGSKVITSRSRASSLTFYDLTKSKQDTEVQSFATHRPSEPVRIWLEKDGGRLPGFKDKVTLATLTENWGHGSLCEVLHALGVRRLYLLSPKQVHDLATVQAEVKSEGLWDMATEELAEEPDGIETLRTVRALQSWETLEDALARLIETDDIQALLSGKKVRAVSENWEFVAFCEALANRPRMELTGTSLDKALAPYVDLLSGTVSLHHTKTIGRTFNELCEGLAHLGKYLDVRPTDTEDRKSLARTLVRTTEVGYVDYSAVFSELRQKFPLLSALQQLGHAPAEAIDHLCKALSVIYR